MRNIDLKARKTKIIVLAFALTCVWALWCIPLAAGEAVDPVPPHIARKLVQTERLFSINQYAQAKQICKAILADKDFQPVDYEKHRMEILDTRKKHKERQGLVGGESSRAALQLDSAAQAKIDEWHNAKLKREERQQRVEYILARCILELSGDDKIQLREALFRFDALSDNKNGYEKPDYIQQSRYYSGVALLKLEMPYRSAGEFSRIENLVSDPELETMASRYYAKVLKELANLSGTQTIDEVRSGLDSPQRHTQIMAQADLLRLLGLEAPEDPRKLKKVYRKEIYEKYYTGKNVDSMPEKPTAANLEAWRQRIRKQAIEEIRKVLIKYPGSSHHQGLQIDLMDLRIDLGQYPSTAAEADNFLKTVEATPANHARVLLIRATCSSRMGETESAIKFYEMLLDSKEKPDRDTRLSALYGLGWCLNRLAKTAGRVQAGKYLNQARQCMTQAVKEMSDADRRIMYARYLLCDILVELGDYRDALTQLPPLLADGEWSIRAHYLSGKALKGLNRLSRAADDFEKAYRLAGKNIVSDFTVNILVNLAEVEMNPERKDFAAAYIYYIEAARTAKILHNLAIEAETQLGQTKAMIGLGGGLSSDRRKATSEAAQAVVKASRATFLQSSERKVAVGTMQFRLKCFSLWHMPKQKALQKAINDLAGLRKKWSNRLRQDELFFYEGKALFMQAQLEQDRVVAEDNFNKETVNKTAKNFENAATKMQEAANANPRGFLAGKANLLVGKSLAEKGKFLLLSARNNTSREGLGDLATTQSEDGKKNLIWSQRFYREAIEKSNETSDVTSEARFELGNTLFELEDFQHAAEYFRIIADNPDTPEAMRLRATKYWARTLARMDMSDEAVRKLNAFVAKDTEAAIMAGDILQKQGRPREAYRKYAEGLRGAGFTEAEDDYKAKLMFRTYSLVLKDSTAIFGTKTASGERQKTIGLMRRLVEDYPKTLWAKQSILIAGDYLIENRSNGRDALAFLLDIDSKELTPALTQAADLVAGRAEFKSGNYPKSLENLSKVVTSSRNDPTLKAMAMRLMGDVEHKRGNDDKALTHYGSIFAVYRRVHTEVDQALISSALIYKKRAITLLNEGRVAEADKIFREALDFLKQGRNRKLMLKESKSIEVLMQTE